MLINKLYLRYHLILNQIIKTTNTKKIPNYIKISKKKLFCFFPKITSNSVELQKEAIKIGIIL